jgi:hypothetical protein
VHGAAGRLDEGVEGRRTTPCDRHLLGGVNRGCTQAQLTASGVQAQVTAG